AEPRALPRVLVEVDRDWSNPGRLEFSEHVLEKGPSADAHERLRGVPPVSPQTASLSGGQDSSRRDRGPTHRSTPSRSTSFFKMGSPAQHGAPEASSPASHA